MILIVGQGPSQLHSCLKALDGKGSSDNLAKLCGVTREELMSRVRTTNLLSEWHGKDGKGDRFLLGPATQMAEQILHLWQGCDRLIWLGQNVARAFGLIDAELFKWHETGTARNRCIELAIVPHPSGVNRFYNKKENRDQAAAFLRAALEMENRMPKKSNGEILPTEKSDAELTALANQHDCLLSIAVTNLSASVCEVGQELAIMKDDKLRLWRFIKDPKTNGDSRGCFSNWRDYARFRLGQMSVSTMYDFLSAHSLTRGESALSPEDVQALGVKKAAQLARLSDRKRTKKLVDRAKKKTVRQVKKNVDAILEAGKPESDRKVRLVPLTIGLPQRTIELINELERDGVWMEGIRDGDKTLSLRSKLWHAVWAHFQECYKAELKEGRDYRKAETLRIKIEKASAAESEAIATT